MEQIKFDTAKSSEIPYLKKLWKDIFKDTDSYIDLYFSYKFKEGNTFVLRVEDRIVSTLYVEYNDVFIDSKIYKGAYFCGILTLEEYRNKGYALKLIEYAKKNIKNVDIIYLIPANESLFEFYKKCGFKVFTHLDKEKVLKDERVTLPSYTKDYDYNTLNKFYENSGNHLYIKRDEKFFGAIYDCYKNIMIFNDGYVIYFIEEGVLHLVEYSFSEERTKEILKGILNKKNLDEGFLYKKWGDKPFSVCITDLPVEKMSKKYVNLMLN